MNRPAPHAFTCDAGRGLVAVTGLLTPVKVSGLEDAIALAAGNGYSCAVREGGGVVCWGHNFMQRLGASSPEVTTVPVAVSGVTGMVAISAGSWHVCARRANGLVQCWGSARPGQLGDGRPPPETPRAVEWPSG